MDRRLFWIMFIGSHAKVTAGDQNHSGMLRYFGMIHKVGKLSRAHEYNSSTVKRFLSSGCRFGSVSLQAGTDRLAPSRWVVEYVICPGRWRRVRPSEAPFR